MVSALVKGAHANGFLTGENCLITDKSGISGPALAKSVAGRYLVSNLEVAKQSDVLVLGVKPQHILAVLAELRSVLETHQPLVISLAAGVKLEDIQMTAGSDVPVLRMMPNVNAAVQASMTAIVPGQNCTDEHIELALKFARTFGEAMQIQESELPIFTALAGCSPAWIFDLIDAFAMAGVKYGISKANASRIVTQAFLGSATLVREATETGTKSTANLIDQVCSPGGTTIAGLLAMQAAGSRHSAVEAVDAAVMQDMILGKK